MKNIRTRRAPGLLIAALLAAIAFGAHAQHEGIDVPDVPDVPAGNGAIVVHLEHPDGAAATEGSQVVLYALSQDGAPGLRRGEIGRDGSHRFERVSTSSGIVYMVGARYATIPYGERVRFEAGQQEIGVTIAVTEPVADASGITVGESALRIEWIGSNLAVEETHELQNTKSTAVLVPVDAREGAQPAFRVRLPEGAMHIDTASSGLPDGFEQRDDELLFWGPVYVTGQQLRYRYLLPTPAPGGRVHWGLLSGSRRASLLYPSEGPTIRGDGLTQGPEVQRGDFAFESLDAGAIAPGDEVVFEVDLPEVTNDASAITLPRVDAWVEIDDTFQQVTFEVKLDVAQGVHLAGSLDEPLLHFELPEGAELRGLSPEAQTLGLIPGDSKGMDLVGPLAPGEASFSYRYRVPILNKSADLDLGFPADVGQLNVLIADTGLRIESDRLHRRRPFRSGTRVFMHREAFQVDRGERVKLRITPIEERGATRAVALGTVAMVAGVGLWFVFAPLGVRRGRTTDVEADAMRSQRELLLESIRDLDLDYETGKLDEVDYQRMRRDLRSEAVRVMQRERAGDAPDAAATDAAPSAAKATRSGAPRPTSTPTAATSGASARFCPACGQKAEPGWKYCAACGGAIPQLAAPPAPSEDES